MTPYAVTRPVLGLANRLLGVTSTLALARKHGLQFALLWEPGPGFSTDSWQDLFANRFEQWDRPRYEAVLASAVPRATDDGLSRRLVRDRGLVYDHAFRPINAVMKSRWIRPSRRQRSRACRDLTPAPAIAREVDAFTTQHGFDDHPVFGVHIRRGDASSGPNRVEYAPSTDEAFEDAMDRAQDRHRNTRFFLATDCAETEARFLDRYPNRIVVRTKPFVASEFGESKSGQIDAAIEMFLLSRTTRVIGTRWSTFGVMAAMIGGIPFDAAIDRSHGEAVDR